MLEREERSFATSFALLLSFVIHVLFVLIFVLMDLFWPNPSAEVVKKYQQPPPPREKAYIIADILPPEVEKRPPKAKFMGLYDSTVRDETVSIHKGTLKERVARDIPEREEKKARSESGENDKKPAKKDLFAVGNMYMPAPKEESGKKKSFNSYPEDFYPDFRKGAHTYLNVLRYPDVAYFVELKRKFKLTFNPGPSLRDHFMINRIVLGKVDVVLGVTLDPSGEIKELFVFRESGILGYDDEALRTIRASGPFSAPPKDFLDEDKMLRMTWTFTTYL